MKRKIGLLTALALGMLVSCTDSEDLKSEVPYYQTYTGRLDKSNQTIKAEATLSVRSESGSSIKLTGNNNSLTCNGEDYSYFLNYSWSFDTLQNLNFKLQKENGFIFENSILLSDFKDINIDDNIVIMLNNNNTIEWKGDDLENNEEIEITINQNNASSSTVVDATSKTIFLTADFTEVFEKGDAFITLGRINNKNIQQSDLGAGGRLKAITEITKKIILK